jgi:hypothetical protein
MVVVAHERVRVERRPETRWEFGQQIQEPFAVPVATEEITTFIPPRRQVMPPSCHFNSQRSCHGPHPKILAPNVKDVELTPMSAKRRYLRITTDVL